MTRCNAPLVKLEQETGIFIDLAYARTNNICGIPIYKRPICLLHADALSSLRLAAAILGQKNLALVIRDAFRPKSAQALLWEAAIDQRFVADPRLGSNHSRGIAVDVELCQTDGSRIDMGTEFDTLSSASAHRYPHVSAEATQNRAILLQAMTDGGFDHLESEWWHYQLPRPHAYRFIEDEELGALNPMMAT